MTRPGLRHELKLACDAGAYARVRSALWTDRACLRRLYPERIVQSVYFDTPRGAALAENLAGISHREKWRVRWYGSAATGVGAQLEQKVRENALGWKAVVPVAGALDVTGERRERFTERVRAGLPKGSAAGLDGLVPAQWLSYRREYAISADRKLRVTLDRDIRAWDLRLAPTLTQRFPTPIAHILILEVKCTPDDYDCARRFANRLPLMIGRSSKFVLASAGSHGPVPSVLGD
ncbi:MAG: VTC domain-containing protein [Planctomycetota bacterium]